jgi:hypothetical protein
MRDINLKLNGLAARIRSGAPMKILIFGLGSVGSYLLDYLMSWPETNVELHVCGRSPEKMTQDINIARVGGIIRHNRLKPTTIHKADLTDVDAIAEVIQRVAPDFLVNSSRVYSGLKYGSISWKNFRAYGLWSPLAVKFIRNIMLACRSAASTPVVINTSYSDAVNKWLKTSGLMYPDFGSGNLNHLVPRIKLSTAKEAAIADVGTIDVVLATSHFHDVVISKEGQTEGLDPLVHISCAGRRLDPDMSVVYRHCAIPMPVDSKRNIMNASSNFEIIAKTVDAIRSRSAHVIHSPGVDGHIGGYPVLMDFRSTSSDGKHISFIEDYFTLEEMEAHNRASISLDGIEDISDGVLTYTDTLQERVKKSFGVSIPKRVHLDSIEVMSDFLISKIIAPALGVSV